MNETPRQEGRKDIPRGQQAGWTTPHTLFLFGAVIHIITGSKQNYVLLQPDPPKYRPL